jgi:serine/threonine-protein kinase
MRNDGVWYEGFVQEFLDLKGQGWVVTDQLGEGGSAAVWKVISPEGAFALKVYKPQFFEGENCVVERHRVMLQATLVNHDCKDLIQTHEVGFLGSTAYILMEYLPWPSMDTVIGSIPAKRISSILACVARAAHWLHKRGVVHRDIKPANVLVSPGFERAILVDLGVVRLADAAEGDLTDHGERRPFVATAQYSSPEYLFRTVEPSPELWLGLTYYQLGATLHDLLTRTPLFNDEVMTCNKYVLAAAVMKKIPSFATAERLPRLVSLASRCLDKSHAQRTARVDWKDFEDTDTFDAERAREKLLLGPLEQNVAVRAARHAEERAHLISSTVARIESSLRSICSDEGYKRVFWRSQGGAVSLGLSVGALDGSAVLRCRYWPSVETEGVLALNFVAELVEDMDAGSSNDPGKVLLYTNDDSLGFPDLDARSLLSYELLRAFDAGSDIMAVKKLSELPIVMDDLRDCHG